MTDDPMMAVCGLLCGSCDIRKMPFDDKAAKVTIDWYREMGWLKENEGVKEALEKNMICTGCHGDRTTHWSADCWILQCCVDAKKLQHCHECNEFPCDRLVDWSKQNDSYREAFDRLTALRATQNT